MAQLVVRARSRWWPALALGVTIPASLACGAREPLGLDAGLEIHVARGPIQPVAVEGQANTAPVAGATLRITSQRDGTAVSAQTDEQGVARLALESGTFEVRVLTCPGALRVAPPSTVPVTAGSLAVVRLECDTGIR